MTVPVGAVDPISLYAAAVEADLEAALWLRPADGIGAGRRRPGLGDGARGTERFAEAERAWQELIGAGARRGARARS